MDEHQAGQTETLVEVEVTTESLEDPRWSRRSSRCLKCAVALLVVMGLIIVALMVGFILHYSVFRCIQEDPPVSDTAKLKLECELKKSDEDGRYNIFTATKAGHYLFYGWVRLSNPTNETLTLLLIQGNMSRVIEKKKSMDGNIFFFFYSEVRLTPNTTINMDLESIPTGNLFHVYEL